MRAAGHLDSASRAATGDGGMARRIREHDWEATPIGSPDGWPQVLHTLVDLMLSSSQPMFILWGLERTTLYNDAYAEILAAKHPALGQPFDRIWHEIWDRDLSPIVARAYGGEALHMDDIALTLMRRGYPEETHFSFSYTPVRGQDGTVEGFFCPCLEITEQVLEERRAQLRAELTERLRESGDPDALVDAALALLAGHLGAEQAVYAEVDCSGEYSVVAREWSVGGLPSTSGRHRLEDFGAAFIADLKAGQSVAIADVRRDPRTSAPAACEAFEALGTRALLNVPHVRNGRLVAVLAVNVGAPRYWRPGDIAVAEEVAERVNLALDRARSEAARQRSEARLLRTGDALALATRASDLGWCNWNVSTGELTMDPLARRLIGLNEDELTLDAWFDRMHSEDREAVRREIRVCTQEGRPFDVLYRVIQRDETERYVRGTGIVRADGDGEPIHGTGLVRDVTERLRNERYQQMLMAELDHRVKNILAVVQAIVRQSLRPGRDDGAEAGRQLIGRIDALARSHTMLARSRWQGARLKDLVDSAFGPYRSAGAGRIVAEGPELTVTPGAAQTLTLALHELVTNAAKHGALSNDKGHVTARWRRSDDGSGGRLAFVWQEQGGPPIEGPPARRGFGTVLIERTLAYELDGSVSLEFAGGGLRASIDLPLAGLLAEAPHP